MRRRVVGIRADIAPNFMRDNPYSVCSIVSHAVLFPSNFVTATSWESYLTDMSKTGTWGTHLEVQMIASMINVTICIVTDSSNADDSMVWLYPNDRPDATDSPILIIGSEMAHHYYSLSLNDALGMMKRPCLKSMVDNTSHKGK